MELFFLGRWIQSNNDHDHPAPHHLFYNCHLWFKYTYFKLLNCMSCYIYEIWYVNESFVQANLRVWFKLQF